MMATPIVNTPEVVRQLEFPANARWTFSPSSGSGRPAAKRIKREH